MSIKGELKIQGHDAHRIVWTNDTGGAVASRQLVFSKGVLYQAQADIAAGEVGTLITNIVVAIPKRGHATTAAFKANDPVYIDEANDRADKAGTAGAKYGGRAYKSATSPATEIWLHLGKQETFGHASTVVSTDQAAANSTNGRVDIVTGLDAAPTTVTTELLTSSTLLKKTAYKVDLAAVAGTIRIDGVGSGTQLDAGDILHVTWKA